MALSPIDALGNKLEIEKSKIDELEARFDCELEKRYSGRGKVTIDLPTGFNMFVVEEVLNRFRNVGWKVEYFDSQRDGASITFSEANGAQKAP